MIPASKSDAQRAYLAAALAKGRSTITGWGNSADEQAMRYAVQQLGVRFSFSDNDELFVSGIEQFPAKASLSAGESGLGIRLLSAVCAANNGVYRIDGEGSLKTRPMTFLEEYLPLFGGSCTSNDGKVPLEITGPMHGAHAEVDGSISSQFISGLLMALPLVQGDSELHVTNLTSSPYVNMTLQTLEAFGIDVVADELSTFFISGSQHYHATHYHIDADWSSASYWLVAAAIGHTVSLSGLRLDSMQADKALMSFLQAANCQVTFDEHGNIGVDGTHRKAFTVDATDCPDLFPALVTLAAYCEGTSVIQGASRLEYKESDRGLTLQSEFAKLDVRIELDGNRMIIHGTGVVNGGTVSSHNDHRIAMCLGVAATKASGPITIQQAESVVKSYPHFWDDLEELELVATTA